MSVRTERLKEVIRARASELILYELNDPRIGFCTVTKVDLAKDLSYARIHVSVLGDEAHKRNTMRALQSSRGLIQREVAQALKTRTTPHVELQLDESIERSFRILEKIKEARASDSDGGQPRAEAPPAEEIPESGEKEDASR
ncbi:MAG: 30S ribosome-binding factor RbfA [Planctomycetota bacterium]|nr:30S ribosome-binding factor RbfA [Planctomycetota bacterium]